MLSALFPEVMHDTVTATLEAFGGDVNAAAEHLLHNSGGSSGGGGGGEGATGRGARDEDTAAEGLEDYAGGKWARWGSQSSLIALSDGGAGAQGRMELNGGGAGDSLSRSFAGSSSKTEPAPVDRPVLPPSSGAWGSSQSDAISGGSGPSFAARQKIDQLLEVFPGFEPEVVAAALAESGGDRFVASGVLMDMMMAREDGGEGGTSTAGGGFGFNGGLGGDGRCENQDVYYSGNQLHAGTGAGAGFDWGGADSSSSSSSQLVGETWSSEMTNASEWERVKRRPRNRPAMTTQDHTHCDSAIPSSSSSSSYPSTARSDNHNLELALEHIRRRQIPEVGPELRRGEAALQREVQQLHEQATALQSSRATLSAHSRAAFQRGDGKLAKELSHRAAALEAKISAAKEAAARTATRYHNNRGGGGGGEHRNGNGNGRGTLLNVDVHGQSEETAVRTLGHVLVGAVHTNATGLRVVTGVGRHSAGGRARLLPAVRSFLDSSGLHYVEEPGILVVPFGARR